MQSQNSREEIINLENELYKGDLLAKATDAHREYILKSSNEDLLCAINYYIEIIKKNPDTSDAYYRLASLMHESGQIGLDAAIEQCSRAVELDKDNANARMYLGYFLSLKGDYDSAKIQFKKAISLKPFSSHRARMVMALTILEKFKNGQKDFLSFSKAMCYLFSSSLLFLFDKAGIKMFCKNVLNDLSFVKYKTIGQILETTHFEKDAYKVYSNALDHTKNAPVFYDKMANIAIKNNRPSVALQCLENAVTLSNNSPDAIVNVIEFLEKSLPDEVDKLIDYYTLLLKKVPGFNRCYYELGHLYIRKEEKINAVSAFKLAIDDEPGNPYYQNSLAYAYVQLEQYDSAIELYKSALETNPDNEWSAIVAQALAAIYHRIKGNFDASISMLQHALSLTKNKAEIYLAMADVYYDIEDMDEAIKYYSIAVENGTNDCKVYSRLAMAFWEKDLVEDAIGLYEKAIEADPEYDVAYNNLGVVYFDGLNDYKRAMPYFEAALELNPEYTLGHFNLARSYEKMGKKIEAATEYQRALDLNKTYPEIEETIIEEQLFKLFET